MKQQAHPVYGCVVFRDRSAGTAFVTRSTIVSRLSENHPCVTWEDGRSYPVVDVDISSASHPFWTGRSRVLDSEGRVEKFRRRFRESRVAGPRQGAGEAVNEGVR